MAGQSVRTKAAVYANTNPNLSIPSSRMSRTSIDVLSPNNNNEEGNSNFNMTASLPANFEAKTNNRKPGMRLSSGKSSVTSTSSKSRRRGLRTSMFDYDDVISEGSKPTPEEEEEESGIEVIAPIRTPGPRDRTDTAAIWFSGLGDKRDDDDEGEMESENEEDDTDDDD